VPYAYMYPDPTNPNHQLGVMSANDLRPAGQL